MNTLEVLRAARKLLSDPNRWTKGSWHNVKVVDDQEVDCYCLEGAIGVACGIPVPKGGNVEINWDDPEQVNLWNNTVNAVRDAGGYKTNFWGQKVRAVDVISSFNDDFNTKYEDVMEVLSKACEAEFAKEQEAVAS